MKHKIRNKRTGKIYIIMSENEKTYTCIDAYSRVNNISHDDLNKFYERLIPVHAHMPLSKEYAESRKDPKLFGNIK